MAEIIESLNITVLRSASLVTKLAKGTSSVGPKFSLLNKYVVLCTLSSKETVLESITFFHNKPTGIWTSVKIVFVLA